MAEAAPPVNALHPSVIDRLDPQFVEIYNKYQAPRLRADQVSYDVYNANRSQYTFKITPGPSPEVESVEVHQIKVSNPPGEIAVQIFRPSSEAISSAGFKGANGLLPAHVQYHGGGFVIGNLQSEEGWCRQACNALGAIILNVDYRLAPEFPHPSSTLDSWEALKWIVESAEQLGIDKNRVSIGGVSAGGNIAAVLAILARDEPNFPSLAKQLLVVPLVDVRWVPVEGPCDPEETPYESLVKNEFAPCLPLNRLRWFYNLWLGTDIENRKKLGENFIASPMLASSHDSLAPASFFVAGVDTLTSEGLAYHGKLLEAGNPSQLKLYEGCGHPFGGWDGELEKAKQYVQDTFEALREAFAIQ